MTRTDTHPTFTKVEGDWAVRIPAGHTAEAGDEITVILKSGATRKITLDPNFWLTNNDGSHLARPVPEARHTPRKTQRARGSISQVDFAAKLLARLDGNDRHDMFSGELGITREHTPTVGELQNMTRSELSLIIDTIKANFR